MYRACGVPAGSTWRRRQMRPERPWRRGHLRRFVRSAYRTAARSAGSCCVASASSVHGSWSSHTVAQATTGGTRVVAVLVVVVVVPAGALLLVVAEVVVAVDVVDVAVVLTVEEVVVTVVVVGGNVVVVVDPGGDASLPKTYTAPPPGAAVSSSHEPMATTLPAIASDAPNWSPGDGVGFSNVVSSVPEATSKRYAMPASAASVSSNGAPTRTVPPAIATAEPKRESTSDAGFKSVWRSAAVAASKRWAAPAPGAPLPSKGAPTITVFPAAASAKPKRSSKVGVGLERTLTLPPRKTKTVPACAAPLSLKWGAPMKRSPPSAATAEPSWSLAAADGASRVATSAPVTGSRR